MPRCLSPAAFEVEDHDAVPADADEVAPLGARRVLALQAGLGKKGRVDAVVLPALVPEDIHPTMAVPRHGRLVRGPVVLGVFILAGQKAIVAVVALGHVDDHVSLFHRPYLPFHFSTCTRQCSVVIPVAYFDRRRDGVRRLIQPARSSDSPGVPRGSYSAQLS